MDEESVDEARHYSVANVDAFWLAGSPVALPIVGSPPCTVSIDPSKKTVALTTPFFPPEPDVSKWQNIKFTPIAADEGQLAELTVSVEDNLHGAYGLLTTIADQVQLSDEPFAAAVTTAIAKHRGMFAGKAVLSQEKEIGLYGELLVLEHLIDQLGAGSAVASWQGPLNEEHDFVLDDIHLEVKTTSSERRRHVIHGLTQLVPLRGVPLSLVSIQLTRSNETGGRTVSTMVAQLRKRLAGHRPKFDVALEASGWKDEDRALYTTYWAKRSEPRAYAVNEHFPAMTPDSLAKAVPNLKAISEVSYRVDVTYFANDTLPGPVAGLVESPERA